MKNLTSLLAALAVGSLIALFGSAARATELIREDTLPNLGIGVYDSKDIRWRSRAIVHPDKVTEQNRVWSGPDLFESEFGQPLDFSSDLIGQYGYSSGAPYTLENGRLVVTTGAQGFAFGFGGLPNDKTRPAIFPGSSWGKNLKDLVRLRMVLEQNVPETKWRISSASPGGFSVMKEFTVAGQGRQTFEGDVSLVREVLTPWTKIIGLKIECLTSGASLKIDGIQIAPSSANVYFRKQFRLAEKPLTAHTSFNDFPTYDLYVNGKSVASGNHLYPSGTMRTVDLAPYLKVGANTIAYRKEFYTWSGDDNQPLLLEGVSVARGGAVTRILTDDSWKVSYSAPSGWATANFDDGGWKNARALEAASGPHMTSLWDKQGTAVPNGIDPAYMGALDVAPDGRKYPLFEDTETPAFRVRLPAGMQGRFRVAAEVYKAGTNDLAERAAAPAFRVQGDWTAAVVPFKTRAVGPYRIVWTLTDKAGAVRERRPEEMIVIGPIPQQKVDAASFESQFEKRLRRVLHFDCTLPAATGDRFLDHSGPYVATQTINLSRVVTENGLTYRETGPGHFDHFEYRLQDPASRTPTLTRGQPYLIEVIAPDNQERAIYSSVLETRPINYFNNGWYNVTHSSSGAVRTGGRYPLSNGWRRIRYLYYPSSAAAAVAVVNTTNSLRAAAKEINVYRIEGGLPALDMPASSHLIGPHDERVTLNASTFGGESPLENAQPLALNAHRDAWYHWYRIYERKIDFLRFQGFNMAVEGLYQYYDTNFPQRRAPWVSDDGLDLPLLAIKMYKRNGIKVFLGLEYAFDPAMAADGVAPPSDRRMWQGEPTFQAVDRYGRQVGRGVWGNANFLHPTSKKYFDGLVQEIYSRYHDAGPVEGLYIATFGWLTPGFQPGAYWELSDAEIGYDDYTAGLFEKETGIALGVGSRDPQRFQKRYALLSGLHLARWRQWRAEKVRQAYVGVAHTVRTAKGRWKLLLEPAPDGNFDARNPFRDLDSTAQRRADAFAGLAREIDMPVELYDGLPDIQVAPALPATAWRSTGPGDNVLPNHGIIAQPETGRIVQRFGALALGGPLDEINMPVSAAARWLWTQGSAGVYIARGVEDNAMNDFVGVLANGIPQTIIYSWLDVNADTGFGAQLRRFNRSFAVTPSHAVFASAPAAQVRGVVAQTAPRPGGLYVRLVNNSPYPLSGWVTTPASSVRDLVYDVPVRGTATAGGARRYALTLKPNDIRLLTLNDAKVSKVGFQFNYDDTTVTRILAQAASVLKSPSLSASIPAASRAALRTALARKDGFAAYTLLDAWDVLSVIANAARFASGPVNQTRLLEMLQRKGVARIDVGADKEYRDGDGQVWLPDQAFLGTRFYGYANGNSADRGDIAIAETSAPRVYQTELWGDSMVYRVPVPNGRYDLGLHFAETFAPFSQPGSRIFQVAVQGGAPESVDLITRAGGQYRALVLTHPVTVTHGLIEIKFSGNTELNGVTIAKAGTASIARP